MRTEVQYKIGFDEQDALIERKLFKGRRQGVDIVGLPPMIVLPATRSKVL
jgi:hypothetical protein